MYRTIDGVLWSDPKVRKLTPKGKLLFIYLITNPHSHSSGIYYLPEPVIATETGLTKKDVKIALDTLSGAKLARYDAEKHIVWVVNMIRHQCRGGKLIRGAAIQLLSCHQSFLIQELMTLYPEVRKALLPEEADRVSEANLGRHSDNDNDNDNENDNENEGCSEPGSAPNSEPPVPPFLSFPCTNRKDGPRTWDLSEAKTAEYASVFPGVDVRAECRRALQWCRDNPGRIKTFDGMSNFLFRWLSREQNRGQSAANGKPARRTAADMAANL